MKSPHRYVTLLATASLVLAGAAYAQSSSGAGSSSSPSGASSRPGDTTTGSSTRSSDSMGTGSQSGSMNSSSTMSGSTHSKAGAGSMARVSKDAVKNRFTAKDLIGAAVYDPAGERIGDIADVDLHGAVPGSLAMSFNQKEAGSSSMSTPAAPGTAGSGTSPQSNTATRPSGSATGSTTASGSDIASTARSTASGVASSASDALADSSRAVANLSSSLSGATVFISVGGLWGIGDDLVSAPVSMLSYNSSNDRFELASTKAQVVALTENQPDPGYAATSATRTGTSMGASSTAAGKQSFGDEASRVQSALRADPLVSSFAQNVTVSSDGDTIELRGSVDTEQHKKQILDAARRATSLKIDDEIDVRD